MLRDAILAYLYPSSPIEPQPGRVRKKKLVAGKRGRPPIPFQINPEIERIKQLVSDHFEIDRPWMENHCNAWEVARPRMVAMYLARTVCGASYPNIGKHFRRDHTTALWAFRQVTKRPHLAAEAEALRERLAA